MKFKANLIKLNQISNQSKKIAEMEGHDAMEQDPVNKNKRYRKPKPWDTDGIDHWKIEPFNKESVGSRVLLEESSFATLFPKYREQYLREIWPSMTSMLESHGVGCELNLVEGSMTVRTTRKTFDPYVILKARDLIKLLARSVPYHQALKIMDDGMACDIIKIGNIVDNKDRFVKRRQRLVGPDGNTLKAIELLTECYVLVQGNTVACMGPYKGLKDVRRIILDCMKNIHPIYHIKELMIKRELQKDDKLKNESWDRFLPHFRKTSNSLKKKKKPLVSKKQRSDYTPFPPAQKPRKIDLQIESGEYFLSKTQQQQQFLAEKKELQAANAQKSRDKRNESFVAPSDSLPAAKKDLVKPKTIAELKEKLKAKDRLKSNKNVDAASISKFVQ